jgi:hypothetical protein
MDIKSASIAFVARTDLGGFRFVDVQIGIHFSAREDMNKTLRPSSLNMRKMSLQQGAKEHE